MPTNVSFEKDSVPPAHAYSSHQLFDNAPRGVYATSHFTQRIVVTNHNQHDRMVLQCAEPGFIKPFKPGEWKDCVWIETGERVNISVEAGP